MTPTEPRRGRRRRRGPRFDPSGRFAAAPADLPAAVPQDAAGPAAGPRGEAPLEEAPAGSAEQVWERTHLEQTMFQLAREHADAAARSARLRPPDRPAEQTHSLVAVLMSYFALEAFINMVGADRLGERFHHYDRMSPEGKWMEITRLVSKTGKTFAEEGGELRALGTLRTWRNQLTHYKGEYEDVQQSRRGGETRIEALLSAENAARAVEIARTLYRTFYELDRRSPPRQFVWLDDRPHRGAGAAARQAPAPDGTGGGPGPAVSAVQQATGTRPSRPRRRRR